MLTTTPRHRPTLTDRINRSTTRIPDRLGERLEHRRGVRRRQIEDPQVETLRAERARRLDELPEVVILYLGAHGPTW